MYIHTHTYTYMYAYTAHRLDSIIDSDRILVMDDGHLAEMDTPKKLLQKRGIYIYVYICV